MNEGFYRWRSGQNGCHEAQYEFGDGKVPYSPLSECPRCDLMSDLNPPADDGSGVPDVELRDARLAAFLAWLVPGLGHLYQGRTGKGLLFMIAILGTFAYGMYLGDGRVVYASTTNPIGDFTAFKDRWHYACQLGIGLPALPAYVQAWRVESGKPPLDFFGDNFERPPYNRPLAEELFPERPAADISRDYFQSADQLENVVMHGTEREKWHHDLHFFFELGTVYTMIAGLMNVLAICDARWGPLASLPPQEDPSKPKK